MDYLERIQNCTTLDELFNIWRTKEPCGVINHRDNIFIPDGIVCPEAWGQNGRKKILFVLKEAYGDDWEGNTLATWLHQYPKRRIWDRVARVVYGIQNTNESKIQRYKPALSEEDFRGAVDQIAVLNLKKSNGKSHSDADEIAEYAAYDREEIKKELELIDADIIICGYTFHILCDKVFQKNIPIEDKCDNWYYHIDLFGKERLFIDYYHPGIRDADLMFYYGMIGIYQQSLLEPYIVSMPFDYDHACIMEKEFLMKVYFDKHIWDSLQNGTLDVEKINKIAEESKCAYYLSVAHLEELHNAEKNEIGDKKGITRRVEGFMKDHSTPGIINESYDGVEFYCGESEYQKARAAVWNVDTSDSVQRLSGIGLSAQKNNGINPKYLFKGREHNITTEYRDVWEIQLVKELLKIFNVENVKYQNLKNNYLKLCFTMTSLFSVLTNAGYKRDKNMKLHNSGAYDIQHAIQSTYCDVFVTNDNNLKSKYKAVAYYMEIPIEVLSFDEFIRKYDCQKL